MGMSPNSLKIVLGAPGVKDKSVSEITKGGITAFMESIILKTKEESEPFFVLDLAVVISLYNKWCRNLPTIQPFYAVKCNPNEALLGSLAALGCNFDCASKAEIEAVLALGVSPDRIVYANPCKAESHIKYAASVGVNLTTYDSVEEVVKIRKWHPKCSLLIRIKAPDDSKARRSLCSKYGSLPMEVRALLEAAHASKLNVIGVSFHIGSAATNLRAYHGAVAAAKAVFEMAASLGMPKMHVLNIGGGFVADSKFEETASVVRDSIETYFPNEPELIVISEPGRFFAETTSTLATNIIGKRVRNEVREYWINDGIYGSFGCIMIDILSAPISCKPLAYYNYSNNNNNNDTCDDEGLMIRRTYKSTIFGPTCDSLDTVLMDYELPELQVNDWLVFPNMGAYAAAVGSNFNGFNSSSILTYLASSTAMAE